MAAKKESYDSGSVPQTKSDLRLQMSNLLASIHVSDRELKSQSCVHYLLNWLDQHPEIKIVASFSALSTEPNLLAVGEELRKRNLRIAYPKVESSDEMSFYFVEENTGFAPGALGVMEPITDQKCTEQNLDLILIPGLGFDRAGGRLGRGKAFYDRYLKSCNAFRMGVCFSEQILEENLPVEDHDVRVQAILSDGGVLIGKDENYDGSSVD